MIVRSAAVEDMDAIYMLGFDVWGEGQTKTEYLAHCRGSEKYKLGKWFCLENDGVVVSSLIIYKNQFGLADGYCGIGSIATHPKLRRNGFASALLQKCIDSYRVDTCFGLLLFSDIAPEFYEKFGFKEIESDEECALMVLSFGVSYLTEVPSYF